MKTLTAAPSVYVYLALAAMLLSSCGSNRAAEASYKPPTKAKNPLEITASETEMKQLKSTHLRGLPLRRARMLQPESKRMPRAWSG